MKHWWIGLWLLAIPMGMTAQQLPALPGFTELRALWNPALNGMWDFGEAALWHRQDWTAFDNHPVYTAGTLQVPVVGLNASFGLGVAQESAGPFTSFHGTLAYAYHLQMRGGARLVIGIGGEVAQFRLDGRRWEATDPDDQMLVQGRQSGMYASIQAGLLFTTIRRTDQESSYFFLALGGRQLLPGNLLFSEGRQEALLARTWHLNGMAGYTYRPDSGGELLAYLTADALTNGLLHGAAGLQYDTYEGFWGGLQLAGDLTLDLQLGWQFAQYFLTEGNLRIGFQVARNLGATAAYRDFSFGGYVGFQFFGGQGY